MNMIMPDWWNNSIDTWIVVVGALSAMACALLGNYLVLRRMSMMGDAISHAVLPGLAVAFLVTGTRDSLPMFIGAVVIGVLTALLVQLIARYGKIEEGASMGVIFTTLFAVGLLLIERAAHNVDLDPSCVLYGFIELSPLYSVELWGVEIPQAAISNGAMLILNLLFVGCFYKELKVTSFDPALATSIGINANLVHYILMSLVAATTVAAFQSVGSILVIAMLIVPAASAWMFTDRLGVMIVLSLVIAGACALLGHLGAVELPKLVGFSQPTSTSGMMAASAGMIFLAAWMLSPRHGYLSRLAHRARMSFRVLRDDMLGYLYRGSETFAPERFSVSIDEIRRALRAGVSARFGIGLLKHRGLVAIESGRYYLTPQGMDAARRLVRSHRLWEGFLVEQMGLRPDHVHSTAERLEHITDVEMRERLREHMASETDPHERPIPEE